MRRRAGRRGRSDDAAGRAGREDDDDDDGRVARTATKGNVAAGDRESSSRGRAGARATIARGSDATDVRPRLCDTNLVALLAGRDGPC
eukprot:31352-Pelagococcus_subviridis.AAC.8